MPASQHAPIGPGSEDSGSSSSAKVPRINSDRTDTPFSFARRNAAPPPLISPQFKMPSSFSSSHPTPSRFGSRGQKASPSSPFASGPSTPRSRDRQKDVQRGRGGARSRLQDRSRAPGFEPPLHDKAYITKVYRAGPPLKWQHEDTPKSSLGNFCMLAFNKTPQYESAQGVFAESGRRSQIWRSKVTIDTEPSVTGIGDSPEKKESENLAALSAVYQLDKLGVLENPKSLNPSPTNTTTTTLSDQSTITYEQARSFMDYYCRRFRFGKPDITYIELPNHSGWEAVMTVDNRRIGLGKASNKKAAQISCYLDVTQYLEKCDPDLWKAYVEAAKTGSDLGLAPKVFFQISDSLADRIQNLCSDIRRGNLYRNRPAIGGSDVQATADGLSTSSRRRRRVSPEQLQSKSQSLLQRHHEYMASPKMEKMRNTRMSLPVYSRAPDILSHIRDNDVTICMAATGSGKTTQIPQLILDDYIRRNEGATCNIICTQPRRLAAISVADRVSKERGEVLGQSVGYHVRFENKLPEENGSVTFCTTGVFLKRMHSALSGGSNNSSELDDITHIVVDEVHERDVDTDLVLVVLKRFLADRKARNKPLKVVLMSATINPTLFQNYFPDDRGMPAKVIEVPGRSYPVTKHFLEDFVPHLMTGPTRWVFSQEPTIKYLVKELGIQPAAELGIRLPSGSTITDSELELPFSFIALTIAYVLQRTDSGHVLVFLPGWEEIQAVQKTLQAPLGPLSFNFNDTSKFSLHLLHSSIPLAEQQVVFDPPPNGVRRIILATNIAETSITIPDVVYVVDTAKVKEQRYDADRHMSSLVSAWVGSSNLNQRAGRAGRHRPGEYYGILGRKHAEDLHPYQTVEMKRVDLSNVVMHVKALDFPGMAVEDVLAACIEPPSANRVAAAMKDLLMVGALDEDQNLTSLGRVLLQLPVEVQMGRLVLFGSFFRCLDDALTLAAIMTNRDPFVSPLHRRKEAMERKNSWCPSECRSDVLTTLQAYNAWWEMQSRNDFVSANRFCLDNFLAKPTLLLIQKIKSHLLQSLYNAGVLDISAGGQLSTTADRRMTVPPELNTNKNSFPVLQALITIASQPKFAIRTGEMTYRTQQDKKTFIHPSSVNNRKRIAPDLDAETTGEKQLFAFLEKRQNASVVGSTPQTYLMTTTRLDPLTYMLFGAYKLEVVERGLECDGWLPIVGNLDALDDVQRLKILVDACMLRVYEGITMSRRQRNRHLIPVMPREEESESGDEDDHLSARRDMSLSQTEIKELDNLSRDIVRILNVYSDERTSYQSRASSRTVTPMGSPSMPSIRLPGSASGYSTPVHHGLPFSSRPGTPSRLSRRF